MYARKNNRKEMRLIQNSIRPTTLSLITTYKCSAACSNCCFECSPQRKEKLPLQTALTHIDNAISTFKEIGVVVLTGGECFLDLEYLLTLIRHIHSLNLVCRVVTNGFWAKSKEIALNILTQCKEAGLNEINFSTGDDHLEYVPLECVKTGIDAASKLNLTVVVNIESGKDRIFNVDEFVKDENIAELVNSDGSTLPKLTIINGVWMPFTQEALPFLPKLDKDVFHPSKDRCKNLFTALTISPTNRLLACCGLPVLYLQHLDLGNLDKNSITTLYNKQFDDFIKIWLFVDGPYKILLFIGEKLKTTIPECEVLSHTCFYCAALFTNPIYLQTVQKYYSEVFASVMLRYSFLITQINKLNKTP